MPMAAGKRFQELTNATVFCACASFLALFFHIVGYSTRAWVYHRFHTQTITFGLWTIESCSSGYNVNFKECYWAWTGDAMYQSMELSRMNAGSYQMYVSGWILWIQAFESIAFILYFFSVCLVVAHIVIERARPVRIICRFFSTFEIIGGMMAIVSAGIYAGIVLEKCYFSNVDCVLGYSFALIICAAVFAIFAGIVKMLELSHFFEKAKKPRNTAFFAASADDQRTTTSFT